MGATDTADFAAFLAANPDLQAQAAAYQQANPSDPLLQQVMYNPLTNIVGPVNLPAQPTGYDPGMGGDGTPGSSPSNFLVIGLGLLAVLYILDSGSSRRR
jgi:hypothetical protein